MMKGTRMESVKVGLNLKVMVMEFEMAPLMGIWMVVDFEWVVEMELSKVGYFELDSGKVVDLYSVVGMVFEMLTGVDFHWVLHLVLRR